MPSSEVDDEIAAGVSFRGYDIDDVLIGVMGIQRVDGVDLIRHAYLIPGSHRRGVGRAAKDRAARQHETHARGSPPIGRSASTVATVSSSSGTNAARRC